LVGFGFLKDYIFVAWVGVQKSSRDVRVCVVLFSVLIGVQCYMWKRVGAAMSWLSVFPVVVQLRPSAGMDARQHRMDGGRVRFSVVFTVLRHSTKIRLRAFYPRGGPWTQHLVVSKLDARPGCPPWQLAPSGFQMERLLMAPRVRITRH